ncbi:hypothetical protein DAEQUDRAFT_94572 [Daedalea quercina L-15889]|uniref:Uncharacterized protein n=1 Tax=Daedalea quercina L-15889 TaxID=1314783 RepID=A0A165S9Z2_9APHY|nr:hypothetical protein DAEQUDRAFT_94572 [Daedalea quercina L-15889]
MWLRVGSTQLSVPPRSAGSLNSNILAPLPVYLPYERRQNVQLPTVSSSANRRYSPRTCPAAVYFSGETRSMIYMVITCSVSGLGPCIYARLYPLRSPCVNAR